MFLPSGFPSLPLKNGIGRTVCQLKRITIKFCKSYGNSQGIRYVYLQFFEIIRDNHKKDVNFGILRA